jgi:Zn-dependent peptidase ImmA (M78 family)
MDNISLNNLRDKYNCSALEELSGVYPVPVGKICSSLGIEALHYPMNDDESGKIFLKNNKYFIRVNASHLPARRRFTVAHELGHYYHHKDFLDQESQILERNNYSGLGFDEKEIEANQFAAELLMPRVHFIQKYSELKKLHLLAEYFFVSELAIKVRLINLGLIIE